MLNGLWLSFFLVATVAAVASWLGGDPGVWAAMVESLRHYAGQRLDASRAMAEGLRARDAGQIRGALDLAQRAGQRVQPGGGAAQGGDAALGR